MIAPALTTDLPMHMLLSSCGPFGLVPDGVCGFFSGAADWFSQSLEMIQNPFRWLYHHTLGAPIPQQPGEPGWEACRADWSQPACPKVIDQLKPDALTLADSWPRLYGTFAVSGVFVAMTACVVRVVRGVFDERVSGMHVVADNVVRAAVGTALLIAPTPDNSLLLNVIRLCAAASGRVAESAGGAVASALAADLNLGRVVGSIAGVGFAVGGIGDFLVAIPILLAAFAFVYMLALYMLRIIQLVFAVATAPLFVALSVYDQRNRFVQWWLDLFLSAMVLPLILAVCGSLTAAIALFFLSGSHAGVSPGSTVEAVVRTLLACFTVLGGVWMTGKAVHGLAWRGFSHGGITGALTAVSTTVMALPNAAGDVSSLARLASGRAPRGGGGRGGTVGASGASPVRLQGSPGAAVGVAASGHTAAMSGESMEVDAAVAAAAEADFAGRGRAAAVLDDPGTRHAFNRAVAAAVGRFAASDEGRVAVMAATQHLDGNPAPADRVAEYTRLIAGDAVLGDAVAGAAVASLLHNAAPDVTPILRPRAAVPA